MNDAADTDWFVVVRADGAIVASTSNAAGAEAVRAVAERDTRAVHYCLRVTQALAEAFMDVAWRMDVVNRCGTWEARAVVDTPPLVQRQRATLRNVFSPPVDGNS